MEAASVPWRPLGELFVSRGLISEEELEKALAEQAATGKRLGEILVERGLVSGPDLTSALMDQLGVEISKEEGFGSGLWGEIKRRHRRARPENEDDSFADEPEIGFAPPPAERRDFAPALEQELEEIKADYELPSEREPEPEPELPPAAQFEQPAAEADETAALRAELEAARTDFARLQELLADAMTALAALTEQRAGEPDAG